MTDILIQALTNTKSYTDFDLNYAVICSQISYQSYNSNLEQTQFLTNYGFTNISIVTDSTNEANVTMACYDDDLYIAVMGTDFSNLDDIINNLEIVWAPEGIGFVHAGYQAHLDLVWKDIQKYIAKTPHKQIIITGHSMGAACGQIINYRVPNCISYYFGSPRVVDNKIIKNTKGLVYQIEHPYDIVPKLPLPIFGFKRIGKIYTIQNGSLVLHTSSWKDFFYSIGYTIGYFFLLVVDKISKATDHLNDMILENHTIINYCSNIETIYGV